MIVLDITKHIVAEFDSDENCKIIFEGTLERCRAFVTAYEEDFKDEGFYLMIEANRNIV
jgi:hypothetical protein